MNSNLEIINLIGTLLIFIGAILFYAASAIYNIIDWIVTQLALTAFEQLRRGDE